jgi:hypothetical protein
MSKSKFLSCVKSDGQFGFCSVIFGWDCRLILPSSLCLPFRGLVPGLSSLSSHVLTLLSPHTMPFDSTVSQISSLTRSTRHNTL